jgi:hypothetical protein
VGMFVHLFSANFLRSHKPYAIMRLPITYQWPNILVHKQLSCDISKENV